MKFLKKILPIICVNAIIIYGLSYIFFGRFPIDNQALFAHITGLETVVLTLYSINFLIFHKCKKKSLSYKIFKWLSVGGMSLMFLNYLLYIFIGISPNTSVSSSMLFDLATSMVDISPVFAMLALKAMEKNNNE